MFSLTITAAGYRVNLDKEHTFQEFIDVVLTNKMSGVESKLQKSSGRWTTL